MFDPYARFEVGYTANGITVYTYTVPDCSFAYLDFIIHAGAASDPEGFVGTAHFLEHMICANSGKDLTEHNKFFSEYGGLWHAATSWETTWYGFGLPVASSRFIEAIEHWGGAIFSSPKKFFDREQSVIESEIKRKYPSVAHMQMANQSREVFFVGTPYRHAPSPAGTLESVSRIDLDLVDTFHNTYYRPENMSVVCVGGLSLHQCIDHLNGSSFSKPKGNGVYQGLPKLYALPQPTTSRLEFDVAGTARMGQATVDISVATDMPHPLLRVVTGMLVERVGLKVRDRHGWAYSAGANWNRWGSFSLLSLTAQDVRIDKVAEVESVLGAELEGVSTRKDLFLEVQRQKVAGYLMSDESLRSVSKNAVNEIGRWKRIVPMQEDLHALEMLTLEDLDRISSWIDPGRIVTSVITK